MHDDFFKSRFEKRKEKIAEELEALEDEAVREKSWHLLGETNATKRENDQLLAMDLDFDAVGAAQAPTVEATETLEAIIIQRIRDKGQSKVLTVILIVYSGAYTVIFLYSNTRTKDAENTIKKDSFLL